MDLVGPLLSGIFVLISMILSYALNQIDNNKEFVMTKMDKTDKIIFKKIEDDKAALLAKIEDNSQRFDTYMRSTDNMLKITLNQIETENVQIERTNNVVLIVCVLGAILQSSSFFLLYKKIDDRAGTAGNDENLDNVASRKRN